MLASESEQLATDLTDLSTRGVGSRGPKSSEAQLGSYHPWGYTCLLLCLNSEYFLCVLWHNPHHLNACVEGCAHCVELCAIQSHFRGTCGPPELVKGYNMFDNAV